MSFLLDSHINWLIFVNVFKNNKIMNIAWTHCWNKMLIQNRIRFWIERISSYLIKIIELKNDNEYKENRKFSSIKSYVNIEKTTQYARRKQNIKFNDLNDVNFVVIKNDVWMNVDEIWNKINIFFKTISITWFRLKNFSFFVCFSCVNWKSSSWTSFFKFTSLFIIVYVLNMHNMKKKTNDIDN